MGLGKKHRGVSVLTSEREGGEKGVQKERV
jgi:hypothetical protein